MRSTNIIYYLICSSILTLTLSSCGGGQSSNESALETNATQPSTDDKANDNANSEHTDIKTQNLAKNGDLEMGSTYGWSAEGEFSQIDIYLDEKKEGSYSLFVHGRDSQNYAVKFDTSATVLEVGEKYAVSFWYKASETTNLVFETNGNIMDATESNASTQLTATQNWKQLSLFLQPSEAYPVELNSISFSSFDGKSFWIDQLCIEKLSTTKSINKESAKTGSCVDPRELRLAAENAGDKAKQIHTSFFEQSDTVQAMGANCPIIGFIRIGGVQVVPVYPKDHPDCPP